MQVSLYYHCQFAEEEVTFREAARSHMLEYRRDEPRCIRCLGPCFHCPWNRTSTGHGLLKRVYTTMLAAWLCRFPLSRCTCWVQQTLWVPPRISSAPPSPAAYKAFEQDFLLTQVSRCDPMPLPCDRLRGTESGPAAS